SAGGGAFEAHAASSSMAVLASTDRYVGGRFVAYMRLCFPGRRGCDVLACASSSAECSGECGCAHYRANPPDPGVKTCEKSYAMSKVMARAPYRKRRVTLRARAGARRAPALSSFWSRMTVSPLQPPLPVDPKQRRFWKAPHGSAFALALTCAA